MKKFFLPILLASVSTNAFAAEAPKVKIGGELGTQVIYRNQKSPYNTVQNPDSKVTTRGNKLHSGALVNDTRIIVTADGNANGLKYGAYVKLFADTSASSSGNTNHGDKVWAYVETKYGRLEGAGTKSASQKMAINAGEVARATGGIDGDTNLVFNPYVINNVNDLTLNSENDDLFVLSPGLPTFCKCKSSANKLVYYTPTFFGGLQIGTSYIMDPALRGTLSEMQTVTRSTAKGFKDVWDASIRYDGKVNDIAYGVSLSGEIGKAKNGSTDPYRDGMKAVVLGGTVAYKGFTVAGSYADWMNTGRPKDKLAGAKFGSKHWTAGVAYEYQKFGVSATYMESKNANSYIDKAVAKAKQDKSYNTYKIVSFGADYKLAEGLLTYGEVNMFKFNRASSAVNNKGTVVLAGTKLKF